MRNVLKLVTCILLEHQLLLKSSGKSWAHFVRCSFTNLILFSPLHYTIHGFLCDTTCTFLAQVVCLYLYIYSHSTLHVVCVDTLSLVLKTQIQWESKPPNEVVCKPHLNVNRAYVSVLKQCTGSLTKVVFHYCC